MKPWYIHSLFFTLLFLFACNGAADHSALQTRIDSLQHKVDEAYKPGLGEFMTGIQVHHAKPWFAGNAQIWKLADFEVGEIKEALEDIRKYCTDRPEIVSLPMIMPPVDSIAAAIRDSSLSRFKMGFVMLTNTCNTCHRATKHEFNVIQVPTAPPVTNQVFSK